MAACPTPENAGKRLVAHIIDDMALREPGRTLYVAGKSQQVSDGTFDISAKDLAQCVNYTSWWIMRVFGRSDEYETLAYIGITDIRYLVFIIACNKTGYKVRRSTTALLSCRYVLNQERYQPLLPSTRNFNDAHLHLLNATQCSKFVYSVERREKALEIKSLRAGLETVQLPSWKEMLESSAAPFPLNKTFQEMENDTALILHSSGTTGT